MTTRKAFNVLTKRTVLTDPNGQTIMCSFPGCKCQAVDIHHELYVSEGGTNDIVNLQAMCKKHHIQLHSTRGDFRAWGSLGGRKTHETINIAALKNLPQFRGAEGELRLAAYIARKSAEQAA